VVDIEAVADHVVVDDAPLCPKPIEDLGHGSFPIPAQLQALGLSSHPEDPDSAKRHQKKCEARNEPWWRLRRGEPPNPFDGGDGCEAQCVRKIREPPIVPQPIDGLV
jgi:hypothetical protein